IMLMRYVDEDFWRQVFKEQSEYQKCLDKLNVQDIKMDIRLSMGSIAHMPQICLSEKQSMQLYFYLSGNAFYVNKDTVVYNTTSLGEKATSLTQGTHEE